MGKDSEQAQSEKFCHRRGRVRLFPNLSDTEVEFQLVPPICISSLNTP